MIEIENLIRRHEKAKAERDAWMPYWRECYDFALPGVNARRDHAERLYDATALDAADQLASSLLGNLTPAWTPWFGLKSGSDLSAAEAAKLDPVLERASQIMQSHLDRSNFTVEIHQAFLDLVVAGTASLAIEEAEAGRYSAFRFSAIPLIDLALEEGPQGFLDGSYRSLDLTLPDMHARYPQVDVPESVGSDADRDAQTKFRIEEIILPAENGYDLIAILKHGTEHHEILRKRLAQSPILSFRWMKSPGEIYGRSPVMKALPDIKTANKVVELILKNASIAVTGIWQADDDGVLNPANIELLPGAIIPKAVGSKGLTPLEMPGHFDVSQIILDDLRGRIRHSMLTDRLPQIEDRRMTATEVLERSGQMSLLLGATYGRLQGELLTPLIQRAYSILRRRGEVPDLAIDGRIVEIDYRSPLARAQSQRYVQTTLSWLQNVQQMGPEASGVVDLAAAARYLGKALGVPAYLMRDNIQEIIIKGETDV